MVPLKMKSPVELTKLTTMPLSRQTGILEPNWKTDHDNKI